MEYAAPARRKRRYASTAIAAAGLVLTASAQATVYTWTDTQGVRHYSDMPRAPDARVARMASDPAAHPSPTEPRRANSSNDAPPGDARALDIVSPQPGQVFTRDEGQIPVSVTVGGAAEAAELGDGQALRYVLDGTDIGDGPSRHTRLMLSNVSTGAHTFSVTLLYRGHAVQHSAEVPFRVERGHVSPAGGPPPS